MDAERLLRSLSEEELGQVRDALPAVLEELGLPLGSLAVDGSLSSETDSVEATDESNFNDIRETITKQLDTAYTGYGLTAGLLNQNRKVKRQITPASKETLAGELEEWLTEEKLAYVYSALEADPTLSFTLVATPNVQIRVDEVDVIAKLTDFSFKELYNEYTPEQLTGYNPKGGSANFSLVPTKLAESLSGSVEFQTAQLARMQEAHSFLRVPRPLEAFTHAKTIEARYGELTGTGNFGKVFIKSFDLPAKNIGGRLYVPSFDVFDDGGYHFDFSNVDSKHPARVAVG